ncbi:hypothetical protein L208DRAFT_686452 [Tricholoma matsutake]|nr:hypothetical protein L208DRAFT_686452 [Tricholoma matsutake 945]
MSNSKHWLLLRTLQPNEVDLAVTYAAKVTPLKKAFNVILWDKTAGMFRNNDTFRQDGNSLAVLFNLTKTEAQIQAITKGLTKIGRVSAVEP